MSSDARPQKSHHAAIKEITDRITMAVDNLYSDKQGHGEEGVNDDEADILDVDTLNWDMELSKNTVRQLLDGLKTDERSKVIGELNAWFSDKSKLMEADSSDLTAIEQEREACEEALKLLHMDVESKLDEKEMHSFQVLHLFYRALHNLAKRKRQLANTAAAEKEEIQQTRKALGLSVTLPTHSESGELDVAALRKELLAKEQEIIASLEAMDKSQDSPPQISDLLMVIAAQQEEINALSSKVSVNEKRVNTLRAALAYLQKKASQGVGFTDLGKKEKEKEKEGEEALDPGVLQVVEEVKKKVRETRLAELVARKEAEEQAAMKVPEEEEVKRLEVECESLKSQISSLENDIREYMQPSLRELELRDRLDKLQNSVDVWMDVPKGEVTLDTAPLIKEKLEAELNRVHHENQRLSSQISNYEHLLKAGESTLCAMEEQRRLFLDAVEGARRALATHAAKAAAAQMEAERLFATEAESRKEDEKRLKQSQQAQDELIQALQEEERLLQEEILNLETNLENSQMKVKDEKGKQTRLLNLAEGKSLEEGETELDREILRVKEQNDALMLEIEQMTEQLTKSNTQIQMMENENKQKQLQKAEQDRLKQQQQLEQQQQLQLGVQMTSNGNDDNINANDALKDNRDNQSNINNNNKSTNNNNANTSNASATRRASLLAAQAGGSNTGVLANLNTLAAQVSALKADAHWSAADMEELLSLQQDNYELTRQVEVIEQKVRQVKASKGTIDLALLRDGVGGKSAGDGTSNVSPETWELRREVRRRQKELHELRRQWWNERSLETQSSTTHNNNNNNNNQQHQNSNSSPKRSTAL